MVTRTQTIEARPAAVRPDAAGGLVLASRRTGGDGNEASEPAHEGPSARLRPDGRRSLVCPSWQGLVASVVSFVLLLVMPARAHAIEYTLEVSDLIASGFDYFVMCPVGHGG